MNSSGPVPTMPGHSTAPQSNQCDDCEALAVVRIQGETDSFGAEFHDFCADCAKRYRDEASRPDIGRCDWCKTDGCERGTVRDYDEGLSGPVYRVCKACTERRNIAIVEAALGDWDDGEWADE